MKTYAFILPALVAGCGFFTGPLDRGGDESLKADDIAHLSELDGAAGRAGDAGKIDTLDAEIDVDDEWISDSGDIEGPADSGHIESDAAQPLDGGIKDASVTDAATDAATDASLQDAASDAGPDAAVDAAVDAGSTYTDRRICQPCAGVSSDCGEQSICFVPRGYCVPRRLEGVLCQDICGGLFPVKNDFGVNGIGCASGSGNDMAAACQQALETDACWN